MQIRLDLVNLVIHTHHFPETQGKKEAAGQGGRCLGRQICGVALDSFPIERAAHES